MRPQDGGCAGPISGHLGGLPHHINLGYRINLPVAPHGLTWTRQADSIIR